MSPRTKRSLMLVLVVVGAIFFLAAGSWLPCGDGWLACAE
jgi:hypothetical protein